MKKTIITTFSDRTSNPISDTAWDNEKTLSLCLTESVKKKLSSPSIALYELLLTRKCVQLPRTDAKWDDIEKGIRANKIADELLERGIAYEYASYVEVTASTDPMNCSVMRFGEARKPNCRLLVRNFTRGQLWQLAGFYLSQQGEYFGEDSTANYWCEGEWSESCKIYQYIPKHQWQELLHLVSLDAPIKARIKELGGRQKVYEQWRDSGSTQHMDDWLIQTYGLE